MSHIIKSEQDIVVVSKLLEKLRSKGYKDDVLEEILNTIIPQNQNLPIKVIVGNSQIPAFFNAKQQKIEISPEVLKNFINKNFNLHMKLYPNLEKEIFYNHILITLAHEVEHYYQSLIANEYVDFPYKIVVDGYKNLATLKFPKDLNPIIFKMKIKRYLKYHDVAESLLERNANVEAYDLLLKVAKYENNTEMLEILNFFLSCQLSLGYKGFNNGAMEKTYRKIGFTSVYNSFDHNEIIPVEDKVRYGLPIDNETRKKVLKKQFNI